MMRFYMTTLEFPDVKGDSFTELTAPKWLKEGGRKGSTMDMRWWWNDHVLTLKVGQHVDTDFRRITRVK